MTFTVPRSFRVFVTLLACGVPTFLFCALITHGHPVAHAALLAAPFVIAFVWLRLDLQSKVTVDDQKIVYDRLGRCISIPWSEVDELHYSPRMLSIGSARLRARMKFFLAEYASIEPFDILQAEVQRGRRFHCLFATDTAVLLAARYSSTSWRSVSGFCFRS